MGRVHGSCLYYVSTTDFRCLTLKPNVLLSTFRWFSPNDSKFVFSFFNICGLFAVRVIKVAICEDGLARKC